MHQVLYTIVVKKSLRSICVPFLLLLQLPVRVHYAFLLTFLLPFAFSLLLQLPCACIMCLHFLLFFYSVSSDSGREYAASGSHHVRGPGLSSCAWKRVVATWACGVRPACQTLRGRLRDCGASARGRVKLAILAVVCVGD